MHQNYLKKPTVKQHWHNIFRFPAPNILYISDRDFATYICGVHVEGIEMVHTCIQVQCVESYHTA